MALSAYAIMHRLDILIVMRDLKRLDHLRLQIKQGRRSERS